jgi:hypothetical protein
MEQREHAARRPVPSDKKGDHVVNNSLLAKTLAGHRVLSI